MTRAGEARDLHQVPDPSPAHTSVIPLIREELREGGGVAAVPAGAAHQEPAPPARPSQVPDAGSRPPADEEQLATSGPGTALAPAPAGLLGTTGLVGPGGSVAPTRPASPPSAPARWGWRGLVHRSTAGLVKLAPTEEEAAHRAAITVIRQSTWARAVNVVVTNPKGGVGKTPTSLLLAGLLGHVRGGYVGVWEGAESKGNLYRRAEGDPGRGLAELLADHQASGIRSAGQLAGYTALQTSHADVLGTAGSRGALNAQDVCAVRRLLDVYYRLSITDTGNNPTHEAYLAELATADAAVLPCSVDEEALAGVEEVLRAMLAAGEAIGGPGGLISRVVVVLTHDGRPETPEAAERVRSTLSQLGLPWVEVPYDPEIRSGEIALGQLSEESTRAWTAVAAAVVRALNTAPTHVDLVDAYERAA